MFDDYIFIGRIRVGDCVALYIPFYYIQLQKVVRLTKTMIILDNGMRFKRETGCLVGDKLFTTYICEPTSERVIEAKKHENNPIKNKRLLDFCNSKIEYNYD